MDLLQGSPTSTLDNTTTTFTYLKISPCKSAFAVDTFCSLNNFRMLHCFTVYRTFSAILHFYFLIISIRSIQKIAKENMDDWKLSAHAVVRLKKEVNTFVSLFMLL